MRYGYGYFEEDQLGQVADTGLWRRIIAYSWPHRMKLVGAILLSFAVIGASLALPYMVRFGIDNYIVNTSIATVERMGGLGKLVAIFITAVIIGFIANFFQVVILEWTGQTIMHHMRQQLFNHMLQLDIAFFHNNPGGKLVTRLTNDIQNMHEMFTSVIVTLFNDSIKLLGIMSILFWMNWRLALILSLLLPLIIVNTLWFSRLAREAFRAIRTHIARINAYLQESISGITAIQLFLRESDTYTKFKDLNNAYLRSNLHQIKIFALFMPAIELLSAISTGCIIWYGGGQIIQQHMTIGDLAAFIAYMRLFFQPVRELSQKYSIVQSAMASAERIFQLLDTSPLISLENSKNSKNGKTDIRGNVTFQNVHFGYDADQPVLQGLSFSVQPGQTLAIVGATGSGKSTIVNLLERFYKPDQGEILIDGQDIGTLDTTWLRQQIGLVMQDVFIISGTIRENILLDREMEDAECNEIIEKAQLSHLIQQLPDGLDSKIGEGGIELSSGQKQLLTFARVLARNPKLLILDEATSSVDSATEILIDRAMRSTIVNRTSIVIAHRLSTIRSADNILVMEQGKIVEQGSHNELMRKEGFYQHLHNLQLARNKEDIVFS